jgi:hypothetical protein
MAGNASGRSTAARSSLEEERAQVVGRDGGELGQGLRHFVGVAPAAGEEVTLGTEAKFQLKGGIDLAEGRSVEHKG